MRNTVRRIAARVGAALALALISSGAPAGGVWLESQTAILRGLDKVTARVSTIEAPVDSVVYFGGLDIVVRACRKRPPEEPPDVAAYLVVRESRGEKKGELFQGWMFASSPALSAIEHPVYDVWVVDCKISSKPAKSG